MEQINLSGSLDHNLRCAANLEYIEGSCMSTDELKALAHTYNNAIKSKKVKGDEIKLVNNRQFLLSELNNRFKSCKGNQLCWLKQDFIQNTRDFDPQDFFRPDGTDGKIDWLSDLNIDEVMDQLEKEFEDFLFIGAVPIDFHEINYLGIAKINFTKIMKEGHPQKNETMMEYNLRKFYYKNILLIQEINKFNNKNNTKSFYEFFTFVNDLKHFNPKDLQSLISKFDKQFNSSNYDSEFVKSVNKTYPNLSKDLYDEIITIMNKKYPIKRIGLIPNLDEHWKGGSHWVSLFANLETGQIYFFDSYGIEPDNRIRAYVKLIAEWKYKTDTGKKYTSIEDITAKKFMNDKLNSLEQKYDIRWNNRRNQYKGSECGVYSINFINKLLNGDKFEDIIEKVIPDDNVNKCREIYFNNQNINNKSFPLISLGGKITIDQTNKNYICE